jgi:hypothetical protein
MCGLCFFLQMLEYIIQAIAKTFIIIVKATTLSSINGCNQNWMTLSIFIYIFNENHINHKL